DYPRGWLIELVGARKAAWVFTTSLMLIFLIYPMINTVKIAPFYSLYVNELVGSKRVGYFFPHDEFYDLGLREAIRFVARKAERGASVAT
ncbi:MAG: hypothetical protein JNN15_10795, partial [Blastocatellia bacterium]|nr:hypothetical protein [Blastocatellia bacterium]